MLPPKFKILSADPKRPYLVHKQEIDEAVKTVLESGWYILGKQVEAFENEFSDYQGKGYSVGVNSGTDAMALVVLTLNLKPGDEVIVPSHTSQGSLVGLYQAGVKPVYCDIEIDSYNIDPNKLLHLVTEKTKAVIAVHLYGQPANLEPLVSFCKQKGLWLIEDASQAHGATYNNRKVGTFGNASIFSCYPTKNLGALGDAGVAVFEDKAHFESAKQLRQYGWKTKYISESLGINTRLDEIQAAILRIKLKYLDNENKQRQDIAKQYIQKLTKKVILPKLYTDREHVFHQFVIRCDHRDKLIAFLNTKEIYPSILYPIPLHRQNSTAKFYNPTQNLQITDKIVDEIVCLPIYPYLDNSEVDHIIDCVNTYLD